MFGLENATITKIYSAASQARNIYGSIILQSAQTVSYRCWIEQTSNENRRSNDGDSFSRTARLYTNKLDIDEGDVLEVTPDSAIGLSIRKWRIENKQDFFSSVGIYRTDINLIEETN